MSAFSSNKDRLSLIIHVLVMLGLLLLLLQPLAWNVQLPVQFWIKQGVLFCLWVGLFYLNSYVLVPRLLFQNKIGWFIAVALVSVVLVVSMVRLLELWLNLPHLMAQLFHRKHILIKSVSHRSSVDVFILITTMLVLGISTSITVIQKWQKDAQIRQALEQQKATSELSFLKAQINPHFFFNTLHSIYALTSINVESAREALYTLSHMMRYVLYETQAGTTRLSKEIAFIEDYIKLMQLRLTDKVKVTFEKPASLVDIAVAPMLLLPFVENAFKHGVSALHEGNIYIGIRQNEKRLEVEVRNPVFRDKRTVLEESSGIGLANTRRRLELLYPNRFNLAINEHPDMDEFRVKLNLDLS